MKALPRYNMGLKRCSASYIKRLAHAGKVVVYGNNRHFAELCERYHLADYVSELIDNNNHEWGKRVEIGGKDFLVRDPGHIAGYAAREYVVVIVAPYFETLFKQLKAVNPGLDIYYYRIKEDRIALRYAFLFRKGKRKNIILFRSGLDNLPLFDADDNARALYDYMIAHGYHHRYKMVWVVKNTSDFKELKSRHTDVISYEWEKTKNPFRAIRYLRYIQYAKYCFFTDACYWLRNHSEDQILVSLWHGCGFKARSRQSEPTGPHYNYMTVNSDFYAELHQRIYGCRKEQMLATGVPKQDLLFHPVDISFFEPFGLKEGDKIVFWLPTFRHHTAKPRLNAGTARSATGLEIFDEEEKCRDLDIWLSDQRMFLFIKLHPSEKQETVRLKGFHRIIMLDPWRLKRQSIHINRLLGRADALISDYSSVAVDFLLLDRPVGFVTSDLECYRESRGFAFEPITEYLPGPEIRTREEFCGFLGSVARGEDVLAPKRKRLTSLFHKYWDGKSCERILNVIGVEKPE